MKMEVKKPGEKAELYALDPAHTDPARVKREREKARQLKQSGWWRAQVQKGVCHHCGGKFAPAELTLDHLVPIARGGQSKAGNVVPACRPCNQRKRLDTPVDEIFRRLAAERALPGEDEGPGEDR